MLVLLGAELLESFMQFLIAGGIDETEARRWLRRVTRKRVDNAALVRESARTEARKERYKEIFAGVPWPGNVA